MASLQHITNNTLEDLISCSICTLRLQEPKHLQCQHAFCAKCLTKWMQSPSNTSTSLGLPCPTCRHITRLPRNGVDGLPADFNKNVLLEMVSLSEENSDVHDLAPCSPCQLSGQSENSVSFCTDCEEYLCGSCLCDHNNEPALKMHHVVYGREDITGSNYICGLHKNKKLSFYCPKCLTLVCNLCIRTQHRGHEAQHVDVAIKEKRKAVHGVVHVIKEKIAECGGQQGVAQDRQRAFKMFSNLEKEIKEHARQAREALDEWLSTALSNLNYRQQAIDARICRKEEYLLMLISLRDYYESQLQELDPRILLTEYDELISKGKPLLEHSAEAFAFPCWSFVPMHWPDRLGYLEDMGKHPVSPVTPPAIADICKDREILAIGAPLPIMQSPVPDQQSSLSALHSPGLQGLQYPGPPGLQNPGLQHSPTALTCPLTGLPNPLTALQSPICNQMEDCEETVDVFDDNSLTFPKGKMDEEEEFHDVESVLSLSPAPSGKSPVSNGFSFEKPQNGHDTVAVKGQVYIRKVVTWDSSHFVGNPEDVIILADDYLLVAEKDRRVIQRMWMNNKDKPPEVILEGFEPGRMAVSRDGSIAVTDPKHGLVHMLAVKGTTISKRPKWTPARMIQPWAVAFTEDTQNIVLSDMHTKDIAIFDENLRHQLSFGEDHVGSPDHICCDKFGRILVSDTKRNVIHAFSLKGVSLWRISHWGHEGCLTLIGGLTPDANGRLFVASGPGLLMYGADGRYICQLIDRNNDLKGGRDVSWFQTSTDEKLIAVSQWKDGTGGSLVVYKY